MKQYDSIKLEAARFERDAQRINLENAVIEGEKLRKEAAILDIELDTVSMGICLWIVKMRSISKISHSPAQLKCLHFIFQIRIDLALKKEQASKQGIIIQEVTVDESTENDGTAIEGYKENQQPESQESVVDVVNNEEPLHSPSKKIKK